MLFLERFSIGSTSGDAAGLWHPWHLKLSFLAPSGFYTLWLAYLQNSLVRVTRRVGWSHFDKIARKQALRPVCSLCQATLPPQSDNKANTWFIPARRPHFAYWHSKMHARYACLAEQRARWSTTSVKGRAPVHERRGQIISLQPLPSQRFQVF